MLPSVTQVSHHVWLNLETLKFYCLPDNYEIIDPSLEDIKVCLISFLPSFLSLLLPFSPSYGPSPFLLPSYFFSLLLPLTSPPSLFFSRLLVFHLPLHPPYNVHLSLSSFLLFWFSSSHFIFLTMYTPRSIFCLSSFLSAVRGISNILSGACGVTAPVQETLHCTRWNKVSPRHRGPQQHQSKGRPL